MLLDKHFTVFMLATVLGGKQKFKSRKFHKKIKICIFLNILENIATLDSKSFMTAFGWIRAQYVKFGWYMLFHQPLQIRLSWSLLKTWLSEYKPGRLCNVFILFYFILFYFILFYFILFFCLFAFSRATPMAYGGSQARGPIGVTAAGLHHSHSNSGSEPRLRPTPQLMATPDL